MKELSLKNFEKALIKAQKLMPEIPDNGTREDYINIIQNKMPDRKDSDLVYCLRNKWYAVGMFSFVSW